MGKMSIRKISVLGLVLMAASGVIAAVLPGKSSGIKLVNDGTLRVGPPATTDGWTCIPRAGAQSCTLNDSGGPTTPINPYGCGTSCNMFWEDTRDNSSNDALGYNTSITEL